jgi:hypothetical protein
MAEIFNLRVDTTQYTKKYKQYVKMLGEYHKAAEVAFNSPGDCVRNQENVDQMAKMKRITKGTFIGKHPSLVYLETLMNIQDSRLNDFETLSYYSFFVEKADQQDREKMAKKFLDLLLEHKLTKSEKLEEIFESDYY